jgi:hypothetical protein
MQQQNSKSFLISLAHLSKICYILRNRFQFYFEKERLARPGRLWLVVRSREPLVLVVHGLKGC